MYIRILGNSASGKTTLAHSLAEYYGFALLHLDSIAFVEASDFKRRDSNLILADYIDFCKGSTNIIVDGTYLDITDQYPRVPDLIIMIDLPLEQVRYNFECRFKQYVNRSREELPNLIERDYDGTIAWINDYPNRLGTYNQVIQNYQIRNMQMEVLSLTDMPEVRALVNDPALLSDIITKA